MSTYEWNWRTTHTLQNYRKKLEDNVSQKKAVIALFKTHGGIEKSAGGVGKGGGQFVVPLLTSLSTDYQRLGSYYDGITVTEQAGVKAAVYTYVESLCPVMISIFDQADNRGAPKMIDVLKTKMRQAELTMAEEFEKDIIGYSNLNSVTNAPVGLENLCWPYGTATATITEENGDTGDPDTEWNTYGEIDSNLTANSYWRNQYVEYTTNANIEDELRSLYFSIAGTDVAPNIMICDQTAFDYLAKRVMAKQEWSVTGEVGKPKYADLGHPRLAFMGATATWSPFVQNPQDSSYGIVYLLSTEFTKIKIDPEFNMKFTGMSGVRGDSSQLASKGLFINRYGLSTSNRRANGVLFNIGQA